MHKAAQRVRTYARPVEESLSRAHRSVGEVLRGEMETAPAGLLHTRNEGHAFNTQVIPAFAIGRFPVTMGQFRFFLQYAQAAPFGMPVTAPDGQLVHIEWGATAADAREKYRMTEFYENLFLVTHGPYRLVPREDVFMGRFAELPQEDAAVTHISYPEALAYAHVAECKLPMESMLLYAGYGPYGTNRIWNLSRRSPLEWMAEGFSRRRKPLPGSLMEMTSSAWVRDRRDIGWALCECPVDFRQRRTLVDIQHQRRAMDTTYLGAATFCARTGEPRGHKFGNSGVTFRLARYF